MTPENTTLPLMQFVTRIIQMTKEAVIYMVVEGGRQKQSRFYT